VENGGVTSELLHRSQSGQSGKNRRERVKKRFSLLDRKKDPLLHLLQQRESRDSQSHKRVRGLDQEPKEWQHFDYFLELRKKFESTSLKARNHSKAYLDEGPKSRKGTLIKHYIDHEILSEIRKKRRGGGIQNSGIQKKRWGKRGTPRFLHRWQGFASRSKELLGGAKEEKRGIALTRIDNPNITI